MGVNTYATLCKFSLPLSLVSASTVWICRRTSRSRSSARSLTSPSRTLRASTESTSGAASAVSPRRTRHGRCSGCTRRAGRSRHAPDAATHDTFLSGRGVGRLIYRQSHNAIIIIMSQLAALYHVYTNVRFSTQSPNKRHDTYVRRLNEAQRISIAQASTQTYKSQYRS